MMKVTTLRATTNQFADWLSLKIYRIGQWLLAIFVLMPILYLLLVNMKLNQFIEWLYRKRVPESWGHRSDPKFRQYYFGSWRKFAREMWNGRPDPDIEIVNYSSGKPMKRRVNYGRTYGEWELFK